MVSCSTLQHVHLSANIILVYLDAGVGLTQLMYCKPQRKFVCFASGLVPLFNSHHCFVFPDVYSYDEDDMVLDSKLPEHLAHFGIDMMTMEKASDVFLLFLVKAHYFIMSLFVSH